MNASPNPKQSHAASRLWLSLGAPVAALAAALAAFAAMALCQISKSEDETFRELTQRMTATAVAARARSIAHQTLDYANWDEAFRAVSGSWDAAWLARNYYSSSVDALIVLRDGQMRYLWTVERLQSSRGALARDAVALARGLDRLEELAASSAVAETAVTAPMTFDGQLALVAIIPITPESDAARIGAAQRGEVRSFLLGVEVLDESEVSALAQNQALSDFRFVADSAGLGNEQVVWPISGESRAAFVWRDERPGAAAFGKRLALTLVVLLVLGAATTLTSVVMVRRLLTPTAARE